MADLEVPQAAVEAVLTHQWRAGDQRTEHDRHGYSEDCAVCQEWVPAILTVAAPHIAAAALREAAEDLLRSPGLGLDYIKPTAAAWLRERADRLDGRQPSQDTRAGILAAAGLTEQDIERAGG